MNAEDMVVLNPREGYAGDWDRTLFDQYKLMVEMADRISARRGAANTFLLSVNSALLALYAAAFGKANAGFAAEPWSAVVVGLVGMVLALAWWTTLERYRLLNSAKFRVILAMETSLPARAYGAERADPKYQPLSRAEQRIPLLFAACFLGIAVS